MGHAAPLHPSIRASVISAWLQGELHTTWQKGGPGGPSPRRRADEGPRVGGGQGLVATVYPVGLGVDSLGPMAGTTARCSVGHPVSVLCDEQPDSCFSSWRGAGWGHRPSDGAWLYGPPAPPPWLCGRGWCERRQGGLGPRSLWGPGLRRPDVPETGKDRRPSPVMPRALSRGPRSGETRVLGPWPCCPSAVASATGLR